MLGGSRTQTFNIFTRCRSLLKFSNSISAQQINIRDGEESSTTIDVCTAPTLASLSKGLDRTTSRHGISLCLWHPNASPPLTYVFLRLAKCDCRFDKEHAHLVPCILLSNMHAPSQCKPVCAESVIAIEMHSLSPHRHRASIFFHSGLCLPLAFCHALFSGKLRRFFNVIVHRPRLWHRRTCRRTGAL